MNVAAASPLLSLEASAREAKKLLSWSEADQALLTEMVRALRDQWAAAWGLPHAADQASGLRCLPAADQSCRSMSWTPVDELAGAWWALQDGAGDTGPAPRRRLSPLDAIYLALFSEVRGERIGEAGLADELAQTVLADWNRRFARLFAEETTRSRGAATTEAAGGDLASLIRPWSGAVAMLLPWCGRELGLLVSPERIARLLKRQDGRRPAGNAVAEKRAPLVALLEVVKSKPVSLRVELAEMEVELGILAGLRPGDVLHTSHRLESPLLLLGGGGQGGAPSCTGYLGQQGDHRAVELRSCAELRVSAGTAT